MTITQMDAYLRDLVQEPDSGSSDWLPTADALILLQEGHIDAAEKTKCLRKTSSLSFTANTANVTLPSDWFHTIRLYTDRPLRETSMAHLDEYYPGLDWQAYGGTPEFYFNFGRDVYVFPKSSPALTATLYYAYLPATTEMEAADESPLPREMQMLPIYYAIWQIRSKSNGENDPDSIAAKQYYESMLVQKLANYDDNQNEYNRVATSGWDY